MPTDIPRMFGGTFSVKRSHILHVHIHLLISCQIQQGQTLHRTKTSGWRKSPFGSIWNSQNTWNLDQFYGWLYTSIRNPFLPQSTGWKVENWFKIDGIPPRLLRTNKPFSSGNQKRGKNINTKTTLTDWSQTFPWIPRGKVAKREP